MLLRLYGDTMSLAFVDLFHTAKELAVFIWLGDEDNPEHVTKTYCQQHYGDDQSFFVSRPYPRP